MDISRETIISALRGCCALKFLHALDIDQGYLAHTRIGREVPKKFNRENLKFGLKVKIQRGRVNNFGINGSIMTNVHPDDVSRARADNVGTIFGWPAP